VWHTPCSYFFYSLHYEHWRTWEDKRSTKAQGFYIEKQFECLCSNIRQWKSKFFNWSFFLWQHILQISASRIEHDVLQLTMLPKLSMNDGLWKIGSSALQLVMLPELSMNNDTLWRIGCDALEIWYWTSVLNSLHMQFLYYYYYYITSSHNKSQQALQSRDIYLKVAQKAVIRAQVAERCIVEMWKMIRPTLKQ
jgi:hypothetical protein